MRICYRIEQEITSFIQEHSCVDSFASLKSSYFSETNRHLSLLKFRFRIGKRLK
jgi:hypothetical protein